MVYRGGAEPGVGPATAQWVGTIPNPVGAYWTGDVLDLLFAEIVEGEGQSIANVVVDGIGDEHAARLGERLQPRRDIDPVAEDVLVFGNNVPEIYANAELDPLRRRGRPVALGHPALHLGSTSHGIDHALELSQETVPGGLDDPTMVFGHLGVDQFPEMPPQPLVRALLVSAPIRRE
jgi:hypothetical protein